MAQLFFCLSCSRVAEWIIFLGGRANLATFDRCFGALCHPSSAGNQQKKHKPFRQAIRKPRKKIKDDQPT